MFKSGDRVVAVEDIFFKKELVTLKGFYGTVIKDSKEAFPNLPLKYIVKFSDGQCVSCKPGQILEVNKK